MLEDGFMQVVVIGLGSMGKRRIRLMRQYNADLEIIGVDQNEERRKETQQLFSITVFSDLDEITETALKCAFVCTPPLTHANIIKQCLRMRLHVFTELNLVDDLYMENIALARENNLILFLSSTFLYREEVQYIKAKIAAGNYKANYIYHVGQYLPDWHPWESYKDFFVADKRSNACRELFAVELPWLIDVFGPVKQLCRLAGQSTDLEIDYPDNYLVMLEHESGHKGILGVDVISRKPVRNFEVFSQDLFLSWNGSPEGLRDYDYINKQDQDIYFDSNHKRLPTYNQTIVENAYSAEIEAFFAAVKNVKDPLYNFEKDKIVLKIIDEIEGNI